MTADQLLTIGAMLINAGVIYGAIKSDLKNMHENINKLDVRLTSLEHRFFHHIESHNDKS